MSCNNCNNTNVDCNNLACGCADSALTNPCDYTDCKKDNGETCDELICTNCVSYCNTTFQSTIGGGGSNVFKVFKGERLDRILQKLVIYITNQTCIINSPQLVTLGQIMNTSVVVQWSGLPVTAVVDVQYKLESAALWITAATALPTTVTDYTITSLLPNTTYNFRVLNGGCASVILSDTTTI
jgi:hypothetical protein